MSESMTQGKGDNCYMVSVYTAGHEVKCVFSLLSGQNS